MTNCDFNNPRGVEHGSVVLEDTLSRSSILAFEHVRSLWVLDRRVGSSHLKKAGEPNTNLRKLWAEKSW
jgi:hypothetical protein